MKKIISLTKVFMSEFYQNLPIFDKTKKRFNKKSIFFWMIAIITIGLGYISYQVIKFLTDIGQPQIFLDLYVPILAVVLMFQAILVCTNIYFFSKDIKAVLHMPIKPIELLTSKFLTLLSMLYIAEGIFGILPITLYGLLVNVHFMFFLWEIIVLAIFPVLVVTIVSICVLILMRLGRFIRNKDIFQFIITVILLVIVFSLEFKAMQEQFAINTTEDEVQQVASFSEKSKEANKYFLIINPSVNILLNPSSIQAVVSFGELIIYNFIGFVCFILIGRVVYLNDILKNMVSNTKRRHIKTNIKDKSKKYSIGKSYINKELKLLIKEPIFFMQCIFPVTIIMITCVMLAIVFSPIILEVMRDESISSSINNLSFNAEILCYILIVLQVLFSISNISLTAFSREGRNAVITKYLPIDLYKQFLYKNVPQILLNMIVSLIVLGILWYYLPIINFKYSIAIFCIATVISLINSYLMLIVDLRRPDLNWSTEYSVIKKNNNKIFQYALMIVNILFLMYIAKLFEGVNIVIVLISEFLIYFVIFMIIDRSVKKYKNKLFNKII